jgi:hypothetical protein
VKRECFVEFTEQALRASLFHAKVQCDIEMPDRYAFKWLASEEIVRENVAEFVVQKVFLSENQIYPCLDLGVGGFLPDGTALIIGHVAGYAPQPFSVNGSGSVGPYVLGLFGDLVGQAKARIQVK